MLIEERIIKLEFKVVRFAKPAVTGVTDVGKGAVRAADEVFRYGVILIERIGLAPNGVRKAVTSISEVVNSRTAKKIILIFYPTVAIVVDDMCPRVDFAYYLSIIGGCV